MAELLTKVRIPLRSLLLVLLSCALRLTAQPLSCINYPGPEPLESGVKPPAALHQGKPVLVTVTFGQLYAGRGTDPWQDAQMRAVCEAARHLQQIWSSQEFQIALRGVQQLVLDADDDGTVTRTISGAALLDKILQQGKIELNVAITGKRRVIPNCAATVQDPDQTGLQSHYIADLKYRCGEPPLLPALTNTLGHEYTHYTLINSTDVGKGAAYNPKYVSYGVGCLTQSIGFPGNACGYPAASPVVWDQVTSLNNAQRLNTVAVHKDTRSGTRP